MIRPYHVVIATIFSEHSFQFWQPPIFRHRIKARAFLHRIPVMMQCHSRGPLCRCAGVGGGAADVQAAVVADAYGVPVVVLAMGADFLQRAAAVNLSVARDVEVVADVAEAAADVLAAAVVKAQAHALGRGRAVNDGKRDDSHRPVKELKPNTPARAVATATMVLRTMPHTDFDIVLMFFWC